MACCLGSPSSTNNGHAMADDTPIALSASPRRSQSGILRSSNRTSSFNVSFQRRQSASDRINEILETARERADSMAPESVSPRSPGSPVTMPRRASLPGQPLSEEDSADETTGITSRGSGPSYQTLNTADGSLRSRKSIYSRKSQPNSQPELAAWGQDQARSDDAPAHNGAAEVAAEATRSWWRRTLARFQSVELENKGSVARDHLALERTFLAWLRTSLAFASIGIAVTQLFRLNTSLPDSNDDVVNTDPLRHVGKPLGATFLAISILILILGYRRYFLAQEWVMKGKFPASRGTIIVVSIVAFAIMALSLVVVIVIQPTSRDL